MELPIFQVDAFASEIFEGNPAAVVVLDRWLNNRKLLDIAEENNLSETAFLVRNDKGYDLRWFSPSCEVPLCGHATLASAYVVFNELGHDQNLVHFKTQSGELIVLKNDDGFIMDFPTNAPKPCAIPDGLEEALGVEITEAHINHFMVLVTKNEDDVRRAKPDHSALKNIAPGEFILTAKSERYDFVSRCFAPAHGLEEDPVTGAAHCVVAPYWADKLGKASLYARQVSARGGNLTCTLKGNRVELFGKAKLYMKGIITV